MKKALVSVSILASAALAATYISNETQLAAISGNLSEDYVLTANITLTSPWTPLGDSSTPFTGTFDGDGYTISDLNVTSGSDIGLFGVTSGATISSVKLQGASVCNYSGSNVGILAGQALSTAISDVEVNGTVCGLNQVGALVGYAYSGSITSTASYAHVDVTGNGFNIGGLVGEANATVVSKSFVEADVDAPNGKVVGGVVGYVTGASAYGNYFKGDLVATGNFGGVVGKMESGSVYDSYSDFGTILGEGKGAGVVGALYESGSRVYNTYADGSNVQGFVAGAILAVVDTANANNQTVYCNAALVDTISGILDLNRTGSATIFRVFNNANSGTALYGQSNYSIASDLNESYYPSRIDTVTDAYSDGTDVLGYYVTSGEVTNYLFTDTGGDYMPSCGFNNNSAWDTSVIPPVLSDVGPTSF